MSWENRGSMVIGTAQAVVYSTDGGTNFRWARLDGEVAQTYDTDYTDPALAIEAAWLWLGGQGGGYLRTRGPGETWVVETVINSQGASVTWESDWSLLLQAHNDLDADMVYINGHNYVTLIGLNFDHNQDEQAAGVVVHVNNSDYLALSRIMILDAYDYGVQITDSDYATAEFIWISGTGVNSGFHFDGGSDYGYAYRMVITRCGNAGASVDECTNITFEECFAYDNRDQLGNGADALASGFICEDSDDIKFIRCKGDNNTQHGFMSNNTGDISERVELVNCDFWDNDLYGIVFVNDVFKHQIIGGFVYNNASGDILITEGDDCLIENVCIESATGQACIEVETANHLRVTNNKFITDDIGLDMDNAAVQDAIVDQNDFNDCTQSVDVNVGGVYHWGSNLDAGGGWELDRKLEIAADVHVFCHV